MIDCGLTNRVTAQAWNKAAHMLYLESPAGSTIAGSETGFSSCSKDGEVSRVCSWDDKTQAVAYGPERKESRSRRRRGCNTEMPSLEDQV